MYRLTDTNVVVRVEDGAFIPSDPRNVDYAAYLAWRAAGNTPQPAPSPDLQASVVAAVQARLDAFARTRSYDSILSACTYASSKVAKFAAEGQCCVDARDAHWAKCYDILAAVLAGQRPTPTVEAVLAEMPALAWPV